MEKHDIEFEGNFFEFLLHTIWVDIIAGFVGYVSDIISGFLPWGNETV